MPRTRSPFRRRPLALMAGLLLSAAVMAQAPSAIDIAPQRLDRALNALAAQTGAQIIFSSATAEAHAAPSVKGSLTTRQALQRLLAGSGLQVTERSEGVFVVVEAGAATAPAGDATTLGEVKVVGRLLDTLSMMKRGETLRDTPQAVTIMTQQRIEEQKLVTVSEVLAQAPGVTVENDFFGRPNSYYSRGFAITNMQVDGTSIDVGRSYYFNPNLAMYEQVEVLRGADGLFAGNGDPGGTVNLARKRARATPQLLVDLSASRWDSFSTQVDVSSPLALDGRVRGRFVVNLYDREFYYDTAKDQGSFFYGTIEADIGDRTVVIAGASKEKSDQLPWQAGLPRYATGEALGIARSTALTADWSTWNSSAKEYFLRVEHAFGERWMLAASATRGESAVYTISGAAYGYDQNFNPGIAPGSTQGRAQGSGYNYDSKRTIYDVSVQGKFDLFGRQHSVLLGADVQRLDNISSPMSLTWNGATYGPMVDIFDFDPGSIPRPTQIYTSATGNNMTRQEGVYGKLQLQVSEPLRLIVGGRYFNYDFYRPSKTFSPAGAVLSTGATGYKEDGIFNPYAGALYDFNDNWTMYGSVTEIYRTQASYLAGPQPGTTLDPMTGRNYEVGAKAELRDRKMGLSFALYRTERKGEAERDFNYPPSTGGDYTGNCCYIALGEVLSQGAEFEMFGELRPGWSLSAGYTYNENENKRAGTSFLSLAPRHLLKVWSTWKVPGTSDRLSVGAGFTAQSERFVSGTLRAYNADSGLFDGELIPFQFVQGGYAVVNAMLNYRIDDAWSMAVNANNLFDRTYYRGLGALASGNYYGEPRNVVVSLRGKF
ncbi:TonB-dependent siderophore receptor [Luteimonas sp. RIT-PG2_3]